MNLQFAVYTGKSVTRWKTVLRLRARGIDKPIFTLKRSTCAPCMSACQFVLCCGHYYMIDEGHACMVGEDMLACALVWRTPNCDVLYGRHRCRHDMPLHPTTCARPSKHHVWSLFVSDDKMFQDTD